MQINCIFLIISTKVQLERSLVKINLVKAFTQDKHQGNPVGVIFNTEKLTPSQMMAIVKETGFTECAFVQQSDIADVHIRFYSPKKEMSLCGHATIATFHLLQKTKKQSEYTCETLAGVLTVLCHDDGRIEMQQATPVYYDKEHEVDFIAQLLGPSAIVNQPIKVSTGTPKLLVELDSVETLWNLLPDFEAIQEHVPHGVYPFVKQESMYIARQFNPATGINEDPVTGVAAGALGAYLKKFYNVQDPFIVQQGHMLNKIGTIFVDTRAGINVGGYAVEFGTLEVEI